MKKQYVFIAIKFLFLFNILVIGCEDNIQKWEMIPDISHFETGHIVILDDDIVIDTLNTSKYFHDGTTLNIAAVTIKTGWEFDNWDGDLIGSDNPATIIMDGDKSITAVFKLLQYPLMITISGEGTVTEEIILAKTTVYEHGSNIQLTATPEVGWVFDHWEGDLTGSDNPAVITMDGQKSVTAVLIQIPYNINLTISGNGTVTKNPDQATYFYNSTVHLTATPEMGWLFDHWEGDLTGSDNPAIITMDDQESVTAVFESQPYITENVIVVVVDGARYSETWGDYTHQYIPRMANKMSNYGVVHTKFYNNGQTSTIPGHMSITTGYYQAMENSGVTIPKYPSIFQYWNKTYSKDSDLSWIITSKDKLEILGNCQNANWEDSYLPSVNCGINGIGSGYRDDSQTVNTLMSVFSNYHPQMILVNFREPDYSGHTGNWENYVQGIMSTDEYIYKIWNYINNDSFYAGKTTMFVTNDHGRHLDNVSSGFADHGCNCEGCRHIFLYSYGPDFKKGVVNGTKRELIDISATIAELLQFEVDYGNGNIMYELFK